MTTGMATFMRSVILSISFPVNDSFFFISHPILQTIALTHDYTLWLNSKVCNSLKSLYLPMKCLKRSYWQNLAALRKLRTKIVETNITILTVFSFVLKKTLFMNILKVNKKKQKSKQL